MRLVTALFLAALPAAAYAQNPLPPAVPLPTVPEKPAHQSAYEPTLYCLYNGIPYSRGSASTRVGSPCRATSSPPAPAAWSGNSSADAGHSTASMPPST